MSSSGHAKDHRPILMPMIIAVVMDERGRPLCCETWPRNTTTLAGGRKGVGKLESAVDGRCVISVFYSILRTETLNVASD